MRLITGPYFKKHYYRLMYAKLKQDAKKHRYDERMLQTAIG